MDEPTRQQILDLLKAGKKLAAVKRHREATGLSLGESKRAVEQLAELHGLSVASKSGCLGVIALLVVALQVLAATLI